MKKHTRFIALFIATLVAFVMLFSTIYIATNADHDCEGEHCQICYQISIFENTLKNLSVAITVTAVTALVISCICITVSFINENPVRTLITLKVKLSN